MLEHGVHGARARAHVALYVLQQQRRSSHGGDRSAKAALFPLNIHIHVTCCMLCMCVCLARLCASVCECVWAPENDVFLCTCQWHHNCENVREFWEVCRRARARTAWKCMRRLFCARVVCCMHNNNVKCVFSPQFRCNAHTYTRARAQTVVHKINQVMSLLTSNAFMNWQRIQKFSQVCECLFHIFFQCTYEMLPHNWGNALCWNTTSIMYTCLKLPEVVVGT